jgi:hypothetical protein
VVLLFSLDNSKNIVIVYRMNQYLRAFIIGSSYPVFFLFFLEVSKFKREYFNFDYTRYTFIAPPALGLMNVVSLYIAEWYDISKELRFLLMSLLAPTIVLSVVAFLKIYNYTKEQWFSHIIKVYFLYFIIFNVIVYTLDKYV